MFWFSCQFAPCGEQNGKTNNLYGVRGGEQTGKKTDTSGSKMAIFKGLEQKLKVTKPQGAKWKFTLIIIITNYSYY
ncbi:hypothetical protein Hanom_Chr04g00362401 [Helianthus anomalus]